MTGGAEKNFGGHEKFILCEFKRGTGAREIYPSLDQINKVRSKKSKGFSGRNRKFKLFFRPKSGDLQKKRKKKVFTEIAKNFSAEIGNLSGFSGQKQVFSEKKKNKEKKGLHPKQVTKSGVSPQKTLIWTSICTPEAPSLLISSGHSPRLGGVTVFVWGAQAVSWGSTAPICPPVAPGLCPCMVVNIAVFYRY